MLLFFLLHTSWVTFTRAAVITSNPQTRSQKFSPPPIHGQKSPPHDIYQEQVRLGFDRDRITNFLAEPARVVDVALRAGEIFGKVYPAWQAWGDASVPEKEKGELLRSVLGSLGPVFAKIGQTLAERPDLLSTQACTELKKLQTQNTPFADELAYQAIIKDLTHDGPLWPGGYLAPDGSVSVRPLFSDFGPRVASASLGQVYKATTWEGDDVAVKVQRANVAKQVVLDWQCIKTALEAINFVLKNADDISLIADTAIKGVMEELDYHKEARNALFFLERHREQPWITAPTFLPEYTGPNGTARVLTMHWIEGRRVGQIRDKHKQLELVNMAVEACVSQLVCTGFVHVDPHEGNILLTDDGRIAFLDFGLMGHVPDFVMEGFAAGIQYTLAGDYLKVAQVMKDVDFIPSEGFQRVHGNPLEPGTYSFTPTTKEDFASALNDIMTEQDGGKSKFGAFFIGLLKMSSNFRLKTPPYIILFVRTFLTLEGIAAQYDPKFNIYEVGLPFAMKRALSPTTETAVKAFRDNVLTPENELRWETLRDLLEQGDDDSIVDASRGDSGADGFVSMEDMSASFGASGSDSPGSGSSNGLAAALESLLGAPEGRTVRRVLADVDLPALARLASSSKGAPIRRKGSEAMLRLISRALRAANHVLMRRFWPSRAVQPPGEAKEDTSALPEWHMRVAAVKRKQQRRWRIARRIILGQHAKRLWAKPTAVALLALVAARMFLRASGTICLMPLRRLSRKIRRHSR